MRVTVARCVIRAEEEEEEDAEMEDSGVEGGDEVEGRDGKGVDGGLVRFEGFENDDDEEMGVVEEEEEDVERAAARVFEKTLAELGDVLGGEPIGIITDE